MCNSLVHCICSTYTEHPLSTTGDELNKRMDVTFAMPPTTPYSWDTTTLTTPYCMVRAILMESSHRDAAPNLVWEDITTSAHSTRCVVPHGNCQFTWSSNSNFISTFLLLGWLCVGVQSVHNDARHSWGVSMATGPHPPPTGWADTRHWEVSWCSLCSWQEYMCVEWSPSFLCSITGYQYSRASYKVPVVQCVCVLYMSLLLMLSECVFSKWIDIHVQGRAHTGWWWWSVLDKHTTTLRPSLPHVRLYKRQVCVLNWDWK